MVEIILDKVFVILVNYNGISDTLECIKSVLESTYKDIYIVVVDNNSDIYNLKKLKTVNDLRIKTIYLDKNMGFGVANNIGVDYAIQHNARYVLLLNNDTVIDIDMISLLVKNANSVTITVPTMYYFKSENKVWYAGGYVSKTKGTSVHYTEEQERGYVSFATGCCMLIHTDIIKKIGLFDENYFMYYEDTDFSIKVQQNNMKILYESKAILWHKVGSTSKKIHGLQRYYLTRNRLYLLKKYSGYFMYISFLYFGITRLILILIMLLKKEGIEDFKEGIKDFKNNKMKMRHLINK